MKGSAYWSFALVDGPFRQFALWTMGDPNFPRSLKTFNGCLDFLRSQTLSPERIERALLSTVRGEDQSLRPCFLNERVMRESRQQMTWKLKVQRWESLLGATPKRVRQATEALLEAGRNHQSVCVVGSRETLESANESLVIEDVE